MLCPRCGAETRPGPCMAQNAATIECPQCEWSALEVWRQSPGPAVEEYIQTVREAAPECGWSATTERTEE